MKTMSMGLEDIASVDIYHIKQLLVEYLEHNDGPACMAAAINLLNELGNYITALDRFIEQNIGMIEVTVPYFIGFHFEGTYSNQKFLEVKLIPKNDVQNS